MKFPRKLKPFGIAFGLSALLASVSVLAASPPSRDIARVAKLWSVDEAAARMLSQSGYVDSALVACVKAGVRAPTEQNIQSNIEAVLKCKTSMKN